MLFIVGFGMFIFIVGTTGFDGTEILKKIVVVYACYMQKCNNLPDFVVAFI